MYSDGIERYVYINRRDRREYGRGATDEAEWRSGQRVVPITQRSVDRKHAPLITISSVSARDLYI